MKKRISKPNTEVKEIKPATSHSQRQKPQKTNRPGAGLQPGKANLGKTIEIGDDPADTKRKIPEMK